tara:strand:+ start:1700 stop:2089 length:390 start_codon:yes stop_codon:yes gene_type:complete
MKEPTTIILILTGVILLFPVMIWAHRCVGTALLATLFAPLVIAPLGGITFVLITGLVRVLNGVLEFATIGFEKDTVQVISGVITFLLVSTVVEYYYRDQRQVSLIKTGPRWGGARAPTTAVFNQKTRLK